MTCREKVGVASLVSVGLPTGHCSHYSLRTKLPAWSIWGEVELVKVTPSLRVDSDVIKMRIRKKCEVLQW